LKEQICSDFSSHSAHLFVVGVAHTTILVCHHKFSLEQVSLENKVSGQIEDEAIGLTIH